MFKEKAIGFRGFGIPGGLAALLTVIPLAPSLAAPLALKTSSAAWYRAYSKDSRLVRLANGRSLNLYCVGSGHPTVILEAGLGGWAYDWWAVQGGIAKLTRVCAYDRAGMGMSQIGPFPRDTKAQVADLEALLAAAKIRPPYVLVGHSMGAYNVRVFASRHRPDVAGIVFVDPATENQLPVFYAALPSLAASDKRSVVRIRACSNARRSRRTAKDCARSAPQDFPPALASAFAKTQGLKASETFRSEVESFMSSDSQQVIAESRPFGDMPLIVLTRTELSSNMTKDEAEVELRLWNQMHDKLAKLSTVGINRSVTGSGHYIQLDKPEAVFAAISEVLASIRKHEHSDANVK